MWSCGCAVVCEWGVVTCEITCVVMWVWVTSVRSCGVGSCVGSCGFEVARAVMYVAMCEAMRVQGHMCEFTCTYLEPCGCEPWPVPGRPGRVLCGRHRFESRAAVSGAVWRSGPDAQTETEGQSSAAGGARPCAGDTAAAAVGPVSSEGSSMKPTLGPSPPCGGGSRVGCASGRCPPRAAQPAPQPPPPHRLPVGWRLICVGNRWPANASCWGEAVCTRAAGVVPRRASHWW